MQNITPPSGIPEAQPSQPEQKREFLERGEVRTLEKDLARVREQEAQRERERITQLKAQQDAETERRTVEKIREVALKTKAEEEAQRREEVKRIRSSILPPGEALRIRDLPAPPPPGKKLFVRLLILITGVFILLNVGLFVAWFLFFRDQPPSFRFPELPLFSRFLAPPEPLPPPPLLSPPLPTSPPEELPPPELSPPQVSIGDAINPAHTAIIQFSDSEDLKNALTRFLEIPQEEGFTRLLFRQKERNDGVKDGVEFFRMFGTELPVDLVPQLSGETFFFVYTYERGNRFGIISQTLAPDKTKEILTAWEPRVEQDLSPLMPFWDSKSPAYTTRWRSRTYQDVEIRFQTFSLQDYGIVHATVDKYVIFASSFEATKAAIGVLKQALEQVPQVNFSTPPRKLSFEQELGQIFMIGFEHASLTPELEDLMKRLQPGGVLLLSRNIQSPQQLTRLTRDLQRVSLSYSSLPLFIAVDQEGGAISRLEFGIEKTALSQLRTVQHAYRVGQLRAQELRSLGINLNLSPVLDSTNPNDFLFNRTFQTGRLEAGTLARALLQGQRNGGILSTLKHFPGYGSIAFNPESQLAKVGDLPDISPFVIALPSNPEFLMVSNVIYSDLEPSQPFPFSSKGIELLRDNLNFQGIILTDDLSQPSLLNNYDLQTIVQEPLIAGVTMLMISKQDYASQAHETLKELAKESPALRKNIEDAASRISQLKKDAFSSPQPPLLEDHLSRSNINVWIKP